MAGLEAGWRDGCEAELHREPLPPLKNEDFRRMPVLPSGHEVLAVPYFLRRKAALEWAEKIAEARRRVSLFSFSLTPVRHRVLYTPGGVWLHRGGVFGRSDRSAPVFRWCSFADKAREEMARVAKSRGIGDKSNL
jgi:hypothetical protein